MTQHREPGSRKGTRTAAGLHAGTGLRGRSATSRPAAGRGRFAVRVLALFAVAASGMLGADDAPETDGKSEPAVRQGARVVVALPIRRGVDERVIAEIERWAGSVRAEDQRPVLVLEFRASRQTDPRRSRFEDALALARFLTSPRLAHVTTVAYLPQSVYGHAVLAVAACERIVMAPGAELGAASVMEQGLDVTMRRAYADIARRRRTLPPPILLGMLDSKATVVELELTDGTKRIVLESEAGPLRDAGRVVEERSIGTPGKPLVLSAEALRKRFGYVAHLVASDRELAAVLGLPATALAEDVGRSRSWTAIRVLVDGELSAGTAARIQSRIEMARRDLPKADLLLVEIDSPGGDPAEALRLAHYLTDQKSLHTVAFVEKEARGMAALVAVACEEWFVAESAVAGGQGLTVPDDRLVEDLKASLRELAKKRGVDWSLLLALVVPDLEVGRYRRRGGVMERFFCEDELAEQPHPNEWEKVGALRVGKEGWRGERLVELGLARQVVASRSEIEARYGVEGRVHEARARWMTEALQRLASQAWFSRLLLFIAFFALMSELSAPGIGAAGFISALAFMLFFWAQFLNHTAGWLEVMLFVGGLVSLAIEVFIVPGFGVFGIGGVCMVMASLVLASQTFVIPQNSYQVQQLSRSLWLLAFALGGILGGVWFMARVLHRTLGRHHVTLADDEELRMLRQQREMPVRYDHLLGTTGTAVTPLVPAGKVRFGDDVVSVVSEGELIERGETVEVIEVVGRRIVVARPGTFSARHT